MFAVRVFFFKQKTADELRISDWSSDVCSSDLVIPFGQPAPHHCGSSCFGGRPQQREGHAGRSVRPVPAAGRTARPDRRHHVGRRNADAGDRKSVVEGKSVSVRVEIGSSRIVKTKNNQRTSTE